MYIKYTKNPQISDCNNKVNSARAQGTGHYTKRSL